MIIVIVKKNSKIWKKEEKKRKIVSEFIFCLFVGYLYKFIGAKKELKKICLYRDFSCKKKKINCLINEHN